MAGLAADSLVVRGATSYDGFVVFDWTPGEITIWAEDDGGNGGGTTVAFDSAETLIQWLLGVQHQEFQYRMRLRNVTKEQP